MLALLKNWVAEGIASDVNDFNPDRWGAVIKILDNLDLICENERYETIGLFCRAIPKKVSPTFKSVFGLVRNHVKLLHVYKSRRGFSKGTVLCSGY